MELAPREPECLVGRHIVPALNTYAQTAPVAPDFEVAKQHIAARSECR